MLVIFIAAVLSFAAAALTLFAAAGRLPYFGGAAALSAADSDKALFRRQMAELDKMASHGLLDAPSAKEARLELARRILAAEKYLRQTEAPARARSRAFLLFLSGAVLFIPLFSGFVYYYQGSPNAADRPFSAFLARSPAGMNDAEQMVRLEALAARSPHSGAYADALAALYLRAGRFQDAANAYSRALALNGETADRWLHYAFALTGYNDGIIGKDAEDAFRRALRLDPHNLSAQLFLARGLLQGGRTDKALAELQNFLLRAPPHSEQHQVLAAALAALKQGGAEKGAARGKAGMPGAARGKADQTGAARGALLPVTEAERKFIAENLGRLEAKTQAEPRNAQTWAMLLKAYRLLGENARANAALARALKALPQAEGQALAAAEAARSKAEAESESAAFAASGAAAGQKRQPPKAEEGR